nr:hypothetical protein Iba_chr11aCG11610 [Ipomoea batatas]
MEKDEEMGLLKKMSTEMKSEEEIPSSKTVKQDFYLKYMELALRNVKGDGKDVSTKRNCGLQRKFRNPRVNDPTIQVTYVKHFQLFIEMELDVTFQ